MNSVNTRSRRSSRHSRRWSGPYSRRRSNGSPAIFHWFSPLLTEQLAGKQADAVVRPRDEEELRQLVCACAQHQLPLTLRGSATGNYGQLVPLEGGLLVDMTGLNQIVALGNGTVRAQAGIRLADIETAARPTGWELRCMPSTYRLASLGGLYGGGFGGIGSINYGPLAAPGQCAQRQSDDRRAGPPAC
ncbi:FAD/FMN-containing dehydrogenase [Klebsiella pneumoniae subsp. pneumoniae]|nr:FAD/FMN-containing dehydrogenase [Klebsiella pneumoniae subsp. pneumoniae]